MRFLLRRALHSLFLLMGASILSFAITDLAPGDFFLTMRLNPEISPSTVRATRSHYGLNQSLPVRYVRWVRSVFQGDWGFSFAYNSPAGPILWVRARNTLLLASTATFLAWMIALPIGIWAAANPGGFLSSLTSGTVSVLLATPELVLALLFLLFAAGTGYFPAGGLTSPDSPKPQSGMEIWDRSKDIAKHLFLPSVCLAAGLLPLLLSHVRSAMREVLQSPFMTAARAHGIPFRRMLLGHALPAAANPLISLFGLSFGLLMSSSLLIEAVFGWPGLGHLMLEAILQRDFFLVIDGAILATVFLIAGNLMSDVLLYAADPRIRAD